MEIIFRGHTGTHPVEITDENNLRNLRFGTQERQSTMDLDNPQVLQLAYTQWMMTALLLHPAPRNFLLLGLGGGSIVRFLLHHHPDCRIDVVEKEQLVIELARGHFQLPHSNTLQILHQDAVHFLCNPTKDKITYDIAFIDIFGPRSMAPPLYVADFHQAILDHLAPSGVMAINLWNGDKKLYRRALQAIRTASKDNVLQMQVKKRSNTILLAFPRAIPKKRINAVKKQLHHYQQHYQLDFSLYLKRLRRSNKSFLSSPFARI